MNDNYGLVNERLKPRLEVLRGYNPEAPQEFRTAYPVASGVTVKSGQLVAPKYNSDIDDYEWVLPGTDTGHVDQYYWANNDSNDFDVIEAGKLPALSCAGQFELQTAYYTTDNYAPGALIGVDTAEPGNIKVLATNATTDVIIGEVSRKSPTSVLGINSNVKPFLANGDPNPGLNVVTIRTVFRPATAS